MVTVHSTRTHMEEHGQQSGHKTADKRRSSQQAKVPVQLTRARLCDVAQNLASSGPRDRQEGPAGEAAQHGPGNAEAGPRRAREDRGENDGAEEHGPRAKRLDAPAGEE